MKIGIYHPHPDHARLSAAIIAAGHEPVGIMVDHTPGLDDLVYSFALTAPPEAHSFSSWRRDTGVVRNPALPRRPVNNGGSRYF